MKLFLLIFSLIGVVDQSPYTKIILHDNFGNMIDGVYVLLNDSIFQYSNKDGIVQIANREYKNTDSISFSHLSYKTIKRSVNDLLNSNNNSMLTLESDVKELAEVQISVFDPTSFVKEAIEHIPENYASAFSDIPLYLNSDISLTTDNSATQLIKYKGALELTLDKKKNILVRKNPIEETISKDLKEFVFYVKPTNFISIIPISRHPVIRKFEEFTFSKYEFVEYKGKSAIKIHFQLVKKHGGQIGFLIIDNEDMAIMSLSYSINPLKDWIGGIWKMKLAKTSLTHYYVEVDYAINEDNKYIFESGIEKIDVETNYKGKNIPVSSEVYLKRISKPTTFTSTATKLEDLF